MGFFSVNKEVFPIGISLCGPIRGTRSDGKLNLIYIIYRASFFSVKLIYMLLPTLPRLAEGYVI